MNGIILFLAAGLGIQHGWHQENDGTVEYIVQVDEAGLEALRDGLPLTTAVPSDLPRIDRVRIQLGDGPLPRSKIVSKKPQVVPTGFQETSAQNLSESAKRFAESIKKYPSRLKSDVQEAIAVVPDTVAKEAQSVLVNAADKAPGLFEDLTAKSTEFVAAQVRTQTGTSPQSQQNAGGFGGQRTVSNSTMNTQQPAPRQSSFGQQSNRVADAGANEQPAANERRWQEAQNGGTTNATGNQTFAGNNDPQSDPNRDRQIGSYDQRRQQAQPQDNSTNTGTDSRNQTSMDSRNGQMSIRREQPDYHKAFSADQGYQRDDDFDLYAGDNLEPVRRPRSGYENYQTNSQDYRQTTNNPPNRQFNYQAGQNQQQQNPYPNPNQQYAQQQQWPNTAQAPANNNQVNPYQIPMMPMPGMQTAGTNPYAPHGVWGMQSLTPHGYNPYSATRGDQDRQDAELAKRDKKIDALVDAMEELRNEKDELTPASNQIGTQLPPEEPAKPSTQWATVLIFLFGSIGANFYLAWIALSFYHRYRTLSEDMRDSLTERLDAR